MDDVQPAVSPIGSYEALAEKIDYPLLGPAVTEEDVHKACLLARSCRFAALVVRPCDADTALRELANKGLRVASVAGHPYGASTTSAKLYEARDLLRRGVKQINAYLNIGKMISRQFEYCETELYQMHESCKEAGAILKVVVDSKFGEEMKIIGCRMAKRIRAPFTATTENRDIELMRKHTGFVCALEVGGVKTLDELLALHEQGVQHFQTAAAEEILNAFQKRQELGVGS